MGDFPIQMWLPDILEFPLSVPAAPTQEVNLTLLATVEDWRRVADQVHWDTMVVAVRPMETLPPASKAVSRLSASW